MFDKTSGKSDHGTVCQIPVQIVTATAEDAKGDKCAICFEPIEKGHEIARPPACKPVPHTFHADCIATWISTDGNNSCPTCRSPVRDLSPLAGEWSDEHRTIDVSADGVVKFTRALRPLSTLKVEKPGDNGVSDVRLELGAGGQPLLSFTVSYPPDEMNPTGKVRWHLRANGMVVTTFDCDIPGVGRTSSLRMTRKGKCKKGHCLTKFDTPHGNFECDKCDAGMPKGSTMYGCRGCNYDLCVPCFGPELTAENGYAVTPSATAPETTAADFEGEWARDGGEQAFAVGADGAVSMTKAVRPLDALTVSDAAVEAGDGGQPVLAFTVSWDAAPGEANRDGKARWHLHKNGTVVVTYETAVAGVGKASLFPSRFKCAKKASKRKQSPKREPSTRAKHE